METEKSPLPSAVPWVHERQDKDNAKAECSDLREEQGLREAGPPPWWVMRATNSFKLEIKAYPGVSS